ncbi:MAG: hypothetical protein KA368_18660 [Acidobacteria bacterium]|nr:hypothetical protein [Acidobacteriota bacterium]
MLETYQATLQDNHLEWSDDRRPQLQTTQKVNVFVTILDQSQMTSNGKAMAEALEKLAAAGAVNDITDPIEWQQQQRQDRALPGRE